jgi:hypothetical protein
MRNCLLALISLAGCTINAHTINYVGIMRPVAGTCDPQSEASLTLRGSEIVFAPASGTIFLRGQLTGQTAAAALSLTDPNKRAYPLTFDGTKIGKNISGTYITPRCRYAVVLHQSSD